MSQTIPKKRVVKIVRLSEQTNDSDLRNTTPKERWEMMWQLALDAWAFKGDTFAEPGLQRHIVRVFRRKS